MDIDMGGENWKNGYEVGITKMGMDIGMDMGIGCTAPYLFYQYSPSTHIIPAPGKTHTYLFKVLICYLYL